MPRSAWSHARRLLRPASQGASPEPAPAAGAGPVFVVGDVHGCLDALVTLLRDASLVDVAGRWCGRDARLWLVGDLVDRGPDGVGAIDLVMGLQREGDVRCLLGNHELLLVAARRFPAVAGADHDVTFRRLWELNGGLAHDLERLTPEHVAWIQALPALARDGDTLILHADSDMYLRHGRTIDEVNAAFGAALEGEDADPLYGLLGDATERHAFADPRVAERVLQTFGGRRIVHGHTPISIVLDRPPRDVTEPFVYAGGRCVNVDHGLFLGGAGFVTELSRLPAPDPR